MTNLGCLIDNIGDEKRKIPSWDETYRVAEYTMTYLLGEIWHLICSQLWHQRDFNTLFNCACSWKQLASIALPILYHMHDVAPDEERAAHDKVDRMEYHVRKLQKEVGAMGKR